MGRGCSVPLGCCGRVAYAAGSPSEVNGIWKACMGSGIFLEKRGIFSVACI